MRKAKLRAVRYSIILDYPTRLPIDRKNVSAKAAASKRPIRRSSLIHGLRGGGTCCSSACRTASAPQTV